MTYTPLTLCIGLPANHPTAPVHLQAEFGAKLDIMLAEMDASPYAWEILWFTPEEPISKVTEKLREEKWDIVLVGSGMRLIGVFTALFEQVINEMRVEAPGAKFGFMASIETTMEACQRVWPMKLQ